MSDPAARQKSNVQQAVAKQRPRSPSQVQQAQTPSSQAAESCFKLIIYPLLRTKLAELIGGEMAFEGAGSC